MRIGNSSIWSKLACAFVAAMLIMTQSLFAADSGSIKGRVLDKTTGEPLIGANVVILNTSLGVATDVNGSFYLRFVPEGKWTLKISYLGYKPLTLQVTITSFPSTAWGNNRNSCSTTLSSDTVNCIVIV